MRVIFWGLVILGLCYAAYSGMIAVWSWMAVHNAVDEVISREGASALPADELRAQVVQATAQAGVPLREREVKVSHEPSGVRVEIAWTMPVIVVKGESVLAVPLSVTRAAAR